MLRSTRASTSQLTNSCKHTKPHQCSGCSRLAQITSQLVLHTIASSSVCSFKAMVHCVQLAKLSVTYAAEQHTSKHPESTV